MITGKVHDKLIYSRRMSRLTELIAPLVNDSESVLDVGCGDGMIDSLIMKKCSDTKIEGIDVLVRDVTHIPVTEYDGYNIPIKEGDKKPDTIMTIDVLHHTDNPEQLVTEMCRCTNRYIVIKDHYKWGIISLIKLRLMDYVGNAHYKVRLPYNYLSKKKWDEIFEKNNLRIVSLDTKLNLYTGLFHILFDRNLHFIVKLEKLNQE